MCCLLVDPNGKQLGATAALHPSIVGNDNGKLVLVYRYRHRWILPKAALVSISTSFCLQGIG